MNKGQRHYPLSLLGQLKVVCCFRRMQFCLEVPLEMRLCESYDFWSRLKCSYFTLWTIAIYNSDGHDQIVSRTNCRWITMHLTTVNFALFQAARLHMKTKCVSFSEPSVWPCPKLMTRPIVAFIHRGRKRDVPQRSVPFFSVRRFFVRLFPDNIGGDYLPNLRIGGHASPRGRAPQLWCYFMLPTTYSFQRTFLELGNVCMSCLPRRPAFTPSQDPPSPL